MVLVFFIRKTRYTAHEHLCMDTKNILPTDEHLSEKQLKFGYWYVTHKMQLRNGLIFFLLLVATGSILSSVYLFSKIYLFEDVRYQRVMAQITKPVVNPQAILAAQAKQLSVGTVRAMEGGNATVDVVTEIANPNMHYWASWTGQFVEQNTTTTQREMYILPGETKEIADLGIVSPTGMRSARYQITDIQWHKVNPHELANYQAFRDNRLQFAINNTSFSTAPSPDGKSTVSRVVFDVTNRSAYSYWSVQFLVNLYRQTSLAAVNSVEIQELKSGETRHVEVVWVQDLSAVSKVEVLPFVNIFDAKTYISPGVDVDPSTSFPQ